MHFGRSNIQPTLGFFIPKAGYLALSNSGFDKVRSDSLKQSIIELFENIYKQSEVLFDDYQRMNRPIDKRQFYDGQSQPIDYETLLVDTDYLIRLQEKKWGEENFLLPFISRCLDKSRDVQILLEEYLDSNK